jgi:uncharacterized membrane protein
MFSISCVLYAMSVVVLALILSGIVVAHSAPTETRSGKKELVSNRHGFKILFMYDKCANRLMVP